jgi:hypothetical protein
MDKNINKLKASDRIVLYGVANNAMQVIKKYFELRAPATCLGGGQYRLNCFIIREDGTRIVDKWWGREKTISLEWQEDTYFTCVYGGTLMRFYIDPKTPCEMVINNLKQAKRNLNKKIVDCQRYMFQVKEEDA